MKNTYEITYFINFIVSDIYYLDSGEFKDLKIKKAFEL